MVQNKLEVLKQISDEFEVLERHVHSKKIRLPEEWFWHGEFVKTIRNLHNSILRETEKLEGYEKEKILNDSQLEYLALWLRRLLDALNR